MSLHRRLTKLTVIVSIASIACPNGIPFAHGGVATSAGPQQAVRITIDDDGATIQIDGELFTRYHVSNTPKPYCWPVIGPTGLPVTRAFPMRDMAGEQRDHPHQRSWWFTHGDTNGTDLWVETSSTGRIVHREFVVAESGSEQGRLVTRNDWLTPEGAKICEDVREIVVYHPGHGNPGQRSRQRDRLVDFNVTVRATEGAVTLGDTKEGTMGLRVADTMAVDSQLGGRIVNSRGRSDADAWGQQAEWVDYYGPLGEDTVGIAIMNHPTSFRFPTYWHVRTYGLFAANPFGLRDFLETEEVDGSYTIPEGASITFRYRIYIHTGNTESAKVAEVYNQYVATNPTESAD